MAVETFAPAHRRAYTRCVPLENHYTVAEAARLLGLKKNAIHKAIQKEQLAATPIGNMLFIHKDELARYRREKREPGRPKTKRSYTRKTGD